MLTFSPVFWSLLSLVVALSHPGFQEHHPMSLGFGSRPMSPPWLLKGLDPAQGPVHRACPPRKS